MSGLWRGAQGWGAILRIRNEKTGPLKTKTQSVRDPKSERLQDASDTALMSQVAQGDQTAYATLVTRHANRFLRLAERLLSDRAEAEDVMQDAFTRLWQKADRFDANTARFTTWFYRVVSNACTDRLRRKKRLVALPEGWDTADPAPNADDVMAQDQRASQLNQVLRTLPDRQRLALTLSYYEELSNQEAAGIMDISVKALESLLVRARRHLRTHYKTGRTGS